MLEAVKGSLKFAGSAGGAGGDAALLLCIVEAMEGGFYVLVVMRCVLFFMLESIDAGSNLLGMIRGCAAIY